jgi:PAS domain S-box-containing protein
MAPVTSSSPPPDTPDKGRTSVSAPSPPRLWMRYTLGALLLVLLDLLTPAGWGRTTIDLWYPPAGLALALIAWWGVRAAVLVVLAGLLAVCLAALRPASAGSLPLAAVDVILGAMVLPAGWWLFQGPCRGARTLSEPRSATSFLFLLPGAAVGLWSLLHLLLAHLLGVGTTEAWREEVSAFWLSRALGLLIVAPPLLVGLTPWLVRRGLALPEKVVPELAPPDAPVEVGRGGEWLTRKDAVEIAGLAVGTTVLTWLAVQSGLQEPVGWQLWGTPLLLIVWASLRQGLRGSTLVASVSAGVPLLFLGEPVLRPWIAVLLDGNLVAQCALALLAASSAQWVRLSENRYRQMMAHVPVVIYSARFLRTGPQGPQAGSRSAEVTLVNAASKTLLGCPPQHLLGDHENWLAHVHPEDREVLRAAVAQVGRQDQPVTCEYRLAPPPSDETRKPMPETRHPAALADLSFRSSALSPRDRWVRDTLAPHRDEDGRLIGWEGVLTDITPQRVLADDLRRTSSMLHALVGNLPAGVFFVQAPRGSPILVNARARQLLGQHEDLAAGLDHFPLVYRLCRKDGAPYPVEELPVYLALHKGLTAMRDDLVVHRPDGRRIPLVSWAAPVTLVRPGHLSPSGMDQPDAAVWVLEDLTTLHQAEAARRDTEGRLRAILETMAEGLLVQDRQLTIVECNSAASIILQLPVEHLHGRTLLNLGCYFLREDGTPLPLEETPARQVLRHGRPVRNLVLGFCSAGPAEKDGAGGGAEPPRAAPRPEEVRWLLVNAMPLGSAAPDARGPAAVVTTFVDVSAHLQAQNLAKNADEKYRHLVESLPLMVIQADEDLRVTYTNPAMRAIAGYELGDVADPQAWAHFVAPDDLPRLIDLGREALAGQSGRAEFRYHAKDGSEKVGLAFSSPNRRPDGTILGTTTLIVDMTRERQLEQELLRAQRSELVGRLASGIAHDFNNLLSVVVSLTELVSYSLPGDHPGRADLERIMRASEQAANLAAQLLTFSKQRQVTTRRVEVNDVVRRGLDLLGASLPPTIQVRAELAEQELFIQADETQIQQILMNLCLNARDAMPNGGRLRVTTNLVRAHSANGSPPGSSRSPDWVRLTVEDNGVGMTDQVKAHLFDPFFSTKDRGTGLGLAVVKQIVEGHGGRVDVFSQLGAGAQFEVWWPQSGDLEGTAET